jgi:hypothetical protein
VIDGVVAALRAAGYDASVHARRPNIIDVMIRAYPLTENCVEGTADIVVPVPETFPQTPPYGFFAMTALSRRAGVWPNVSNAAPYAQATFFSRKCTTWDPSRDDVMTVLAFINRWTSS